MNSQSQVGHFYHTLQDSVNIMEEETGKMLGPEDGKGRYEMLCSGYDMAGALVNS